MSHHFDALAAAYRNTGEHNDQLHTQLTKETWTTPHLADHRRHIEQNKLGFGDPCFHAAWQHLFLEAQARFGSVRALEIGVFKGQVISLWSLLARHYKIDLQASAITPLEGSPLPGSKLWLRIRALLDRKFRERLANGDFYETEDYEKIIRALFRHFDLDFAQIALHRGYSTDPVILKQVAAHTYHIIYVDGDHTLEGARHDFSTFGPKVVPGGWLVADDAGCDLPGTTFWKGHASVSVAARDLPSLGFVNVLNVGHNRFYQRQA